MNLESMILNSISGLTKDERIGLVMQLADQLDVRAHVITTEEAESVARREVQKALSEATAPVIRHGDEVKTEQGTARAVVLNGEEEALLQKLFEVANAA